MIWCGFTNILAEYIHGNIVTFSLLVLKANYDLFISRHKFVSRILFNTSIILLTRRGAYLSIHYSIILWRNQNEYIQKSGTGHNSKKQISSVILSNPGRPSSNNNSLVDNHLPPPLVPDIDITMAVADQVII